MKRINIKLNLSQLKSVVRYEKSATGMIECVIIPIEANFLFKGEKGIYLDLTAFELKNPKEGSRDTHLIKQSLPKDVFEAMNEDQRRAMPIVGNCSVYDAEEQKPVSSPTPIDATDDLPF